MNNADIHGAFADLSTPQIADACVRLDLPLRAAPAGIRAIDPQQRLAGAVLPSRHYGSVDVFLEAMESARQGDILVIDNQGRVDEGCIGDLTVLEARSSGIAGLVVWGFHRDTRDLIAIGVPVFSYGVFSGGPRRLDAREPGALKSARFGEVSATREDVVFADEDGVLFVAAAELTKVLETATSIRKTEKAQADAVKGGRNLREQLRFEEFLGRRAAEPGYTFRQHLRRVGGAIEE